jgi:hypothetical protein
MLNVTTQWREPKATRTHFHVPVAHQLSRIGEPALYICGNNTKYIEISAIQTSTKTALLIHALAG